MVVGQESGRSNRIRVVAEFSLFSDFITRIDYTIIKYGQLKPITDKDVIVQNNYTLNCIKNA